MIFVRATRIALILSPAFVLTSHSSSVMENSNCKGQLTKTPAYENRSVL